jgi:hypothetical protein
MYQKDTLVVVPTPGEDGSMHVKYLNINNIAQQFAEVPNSFNIFLVEACRVQLKSTEGVNAEAEPMIPSRKLPGVSIIIHSCEAGSPATEQSTPDGQKAWCQGTQKFLNRLTEMQAKKQYSW